MLHNQSRSLLEQLAQQNRRVVSDWRTLILLRRATAQIPAAQRRWRDAPREVSDVHPLLRDLVSHGDLAKIPRLSQTYEVTVPYARSSYIEPEEILFEAHPYSTISHISALVIHGLTDELPKLITATKPSKRPADLYPLDTIAEDWIGIAPPLIRRFASIQGQRIEWCGVAPERYFGFREYRPHGYALRVTDVERTLLDALQTPALSGGIENVLRAWLLGRDVIDVESLVSYVERLNVGILRQRVGYVLDQLALPNPKRDAWLAKAPRGGSSKLVATEAYSPSYDERWNLSLNAPLEALSGAN